MLLNSFSGVYLGAGDWLLVAMNLETENRFLPSVRLGGGLRLEPGMRLGGARDVFHVTKPVPIIHLVCARESREMTRSQHSILLAGHLAQPGMEGSYTLHRLQHSHPQMGIILNTNFLNC